MSPRSGCHRRLLLATLARLSLVLPGGLGTSSSFPTNLLVSTYSHSQLRDESWACSGPHKPGLEHAYSHLSRSLQSPALYLNTHLHTPLHSSLDTRSRHVVSKHISSRALAAVLSSCRMGPQSASRAANRRTASRTDSQTCCLCDGWQPQICEDSPHGDGRRTQLGLRGSR